MSIEGGKAHGCLRRRQERDDCVVAGRTEWAVECFLRRMGACKCRLRREIVVDEWKEEIKSGVVWCGYGCDAKRGESKQKAINGGP